MKLSEIIMGLDSISLPFSTVSANNLFVNTVFLIATIPAMWYLFAVLFKRVVNFNLDNSYWNFLFFIPVTAYLFGIFNSMSYSADTGVTPYLRLIILILLNILSYLSFVSVLFMLIKTNDSIVSAERTAATQRQMLLQNEQYSKLTESISQAFKIRHDMRHHFIALKGFAEQHDYDRIISYLDSFMDDDTDTVPTQICAKHSVDMILRHYVGKARAMGITVDYAVDLPENFPMEDADLTIVFGNLVENALESCSRQESGEKFISIKTKLVNKTMLAATISNSFSGEIKSDNAIFMSQKHTGYGIGTQSVKDVAERSGGNCKFSYDNHVFKASVLLVP